MIKSQHIDFGMFILAYIFCSLALMLAIVVAAFKWQTFANFLIAHNSLLTLLIQVFAVVAAIVAAAVALLVQNKSKRDRQVEVTLDCVSFWRSESFLNISKHLTKLIDSNKTKRKSNEYESIDDFKEEASVVNERLAKLSDVKNRDAKSFKNIHNYLSEVESVAIKIKNGVFDEKIIYEQMGLIIYLNTSFYLSGFIGGVHKWYPGIYKNTEWLIEEWKIKGEESVETFILNQFASQDT